MCEKSSILHLNTPLTPFKKQMCGKKTQIKTKVDIFTKKARIQTKRIKNKRGQ